MITTHLMFTHMSGLIRKVILKNIKNVNVNNGEMDKLSLQQRRRVNTCA